MTTLDDLRRYAIARSLFPKTTLPRALMRLGFVQADPIRAPARAQDLTLRHRVRGYRAGDLERRYPTLPVFEDFFVNYGFVTAEVQALMHPRGGAPPWPRSRRDRVEALLAFVAERQVVHPREVDAHFAHGSVRNYWGGSSSATTHLLDGMHYRGLLRVVKRERGVRLYALHTHGDAPRDRAARDARLDALVDVVVRVYAPLPRVTLLWLVRRLRYAAPQWRRDLTAALTRARQRLSRATVDGVEWYWPAGETPQTDAGEAVVRLLGPFDPVVWDRRRFEIFWGWPYRFEAYTPPAKRRLGYYALPLLWREQVVGWANVTVRGEALDVDVGYVTARPTARGYAAALDAEIASLRTFLRLPPA